MDDFTVAFDWAEYYKGQIEWDKRQLEWERKDLEWNNREIASERAKDRELVEYVWSKGVLTMIDFKIYGDPKKYVGTKTRQYMKWRLGNYKRIKYYERQIERDTQQYEIWSKRNEKRA